MRVKTLIMTSFIDDFNLDKETIRKIGLRPSHEAINATNAADARVFDYPDLNRVFVMESDLYGNTMPKDSCFLAFYGQHGLIGKRLKVEVLKNSSVEDIKNIVESNNYG